MNELEQCQYYKQGVDFFNNTPGFKDKPVWSQDLHKLLYESDSSLRKINTDFLTDFNKGFNDAHRDYWHKTLEVDNFIKELEDLCKKYDAHISFGCGCCGAGSNINGFDFSFQI
jgi:hypothetical protein